MASTTRTGIVSTGFIWKPDKDTKDVQVLLCKARGIYADNFVDDHNCGLKYTAHTLEQRNQEFGGFSGCVPLKADVYHFLFRVDYVDGQQHFRASELYPRTVLASGREVNYVEAPNFMFFKSTALDESPSVRSSLHHSGKKPETDSIPKMKSHSSHCVLL